MELKPEPLEDHERQLAEIMMRRGRFYDDVLHRRRGELRSDASKELEAVRRAWERLPDDARGLLSHILQHRAGVAEAAMVDVGEAVTEALSAIAYRRPPDVPGLRDAVAALHQIWCERGRPAAIRNLERDRVAGLGPSDLHLFVARHVIELFGREAFSRSRNDADVVDAACTKVDTALTGR